MISPGVFFFFFLHFFKILIFWVVRRVKRIKMAQNNKKFCPLCLIFQEPYIIWSSFMEQMCKRIIYPVFLFFPNFNFGFNSGVKGKKWPKMTKNCLSHSISQEAYINDCDFWYTCVKWWNLQLLFSFFKILIFWVVKRVKGQEMAQNDK